jgi:cytochrome c-type biogenesis protein CcmH/NrfG
VLLLSIPYGEHCRPHLRGVRGVRRGATRPVTVGARAPHRRAAVATRSTAQPTSIPPQQQPTLQAAQPPEPPLPAEYHAGLNAAKDKDWLGAERAYRNALQKSPSNPDIWYKLGVALGEQKRRPDAIGAYREAIRLNRDHVDSWYNLGLELSRQRDYRAALAAFREVTRLEPTNARGWKILGDLHIVNKEYVQAVRALQEGVRLKPDDGDIWYDLGSVHVLANNRQDATKVYERLKQLDPAKATQLQREGLDRMP